LVCGLFEGAVTLNAPALTDQSVERSRLHIADPVRPLPGEGRGVGHALRFKTHVHAGPFSHLTVSFLQKPGRSRTGLSLC
jgi:hypothetical protein